MRIPMSRDSRKNNPVINIGARNNEQATKTPTNLLPKTNINKETFSIISMHHNTMAIRMTATMIAPITPKY